MAAPTHVEAEWPLPEPRWGIPHVLVGFVAVFLLGAVVGGLVLAIAGYDTYDDAPLAVIALSNLGLWGGFLGVPILVSARLGNGWVRDFSVALRAIDVPVAAVAGFLAQLLMVPLVSWPFIELAGKTADDLSEPARELADKATGAAGPLVFLLMVGVLAPIAEEVFFRGFALRALERRIGTVGGLIASSAFFAATHGQPLQAPALFVAGMLFGWLVVRTGRLGPAIVAHMAFNITTVVALLWL
jgi:membrane protease YdiL (CAAX protease family)